MTRYFRNRSCRCARCKARNLMGAAIMVTLGVLFLIQEYWYIDFDRTWPVLLIVIGLFIFAGHNASMEGHVQPRWAGGNAAVPPFDGDPPRQHQTDQQVKL